MHFMFLKEAYYTIAQRLQNVRERERDCKLEVDITTVTSVPGMQDVWQGHFGVAGESSAESGTE